MWWILRAILLILLLEVSPAGFSAVSTPDSDPVPCSLCRKRIDGSFLQIPGLKDRYCESCYMAHPHCTFCGRPAPAVQSDGSVSAPVCQNCRAQAVNDPEEASRILERVSHWFTRDLSLRISRSLHFRVVGALTEIPGAALSGDARELGAFVREGDRSTIVLLQGLPEPLLVETAAHELTHVWQAENCPPNQELILKEGLAQWVAAQALRAFGHSEALQVLRERPDLYGQGFRRLDSIEHEKGRAFLLRYIKETR